MKMDEAWHYKHNVSLIPQAVILAVQINLYISSFKFHYLEEM